MYDFMHVKYPGWKNPEREHLVASRAEEVGLGEWLLCGSGVSIWSEEKVLMVT